MMSISGDIIDDLTGDKTRLEFLRSKINGLKRTLKYYEELETHEVCLMNNIYYKLNFKK